MPRARVNGIEVEYELTKAAVDKSRDETMVLIMGLGCQMLHWPDPFVRALAREGYNVLRFDNRDVGLSTHFNHLKPQPASKMDMARWLVGAKLKSHYSLNDMVLDTLSLMDHLNINAAHIVGCSMGGMIGQLLAIHHPERALSLTSMMSTSGNRRVGHPRSETMKVMRSRPISSDKTALVEFGLRNWTALQGASYKTPIDKLRPHLERVVERAVSPAGFQRQLQAVLNAGNREGLLKKLKVPTLVQHGDDDPLINVSGGRSVANAVPGAKLEIIEGWGHDLPYELHARLVGSIVEHAEKASSLRRAA